MEQKIAIKYLNSIVVDVVPTLVYGEMKTNGQTMAVVANWMALGFMPTEKLVNGMETLSISALSDLVKEVTPILKEMVGANVVHKPFYPNFPKQVMDMDEAELYRNAIAHYWTEGTWLPDFEVKSRPVEFESVKWKVLDRADAYDVDQVFAKLLSSADSISGESKEAVAWFIDSGRDQCVPDRIPFKENICLVAAEYLEQGKWNDRLVKDTTDILRIATHLSGGDISLAEPTKFKNQPRSVRRKLVRSLENVIRLEDLVRHKEKWIRLLHNLHVGDYSEKVYRMAKKLREHGKIETFNGKLEAAIQSKDWDTAVALLQQRPGEYARKLARILTEAGRSRRKVVDGFSYVVRDVPTRNLMQLWGSMKTRITDVEKRVVFPKGSMAKATVLRNKLNRLPKVHIERVGDMIRDALIARFAEGEDMGKVWIDPGLYGCPLPTGMRSASANLREVARGSRLPIGDKSTLRFFIYWKGRDIDLSATFHDEEFNLVERVAFYNLKSGKLKAHHSGDITNAPRGASEFIDIDIASALAHNSNIRYVSMQVYVYSGPNFADHEECFAGWMTRNKPNSNEIYDPKTVQEKIDLRANSRNAMPVMFDLKTREAIWVDVTTPSRGVESAFNKFGRSGNTVDASRATIQDMIEAFVSLDNKMTLGDLLELHALARGELVEDREEADFVVGYDEKADLTPFNVMEINSDYVV